MGQYDEEARIAPPLLDDDEAGLVEESLRLLNDRYDRVVGLLLRGAVRRGAELRAMFPAAMDVQRDRFFKALTAAAHEMSNFQRLVPMLAQLGREHRKYGVRPEHFDVFGRALLDTLRHHRPPTGRRSSRQAWTRAYRLIADVMMDGAREAAAHEPAWWRGEVIAHERRADDIAVLRGAHRTGPTTTSRASTPASRRRTGRGSGGPTRWPPRRRPTGCSSSTSARSAAGWVSGPLVWRAQVGDVLRIGAPMGDMHDRPAVPAGTSCCVAGGTGLAPIKALVDGMARWNTARSVTLFFGARRAGDLYDMGALHRLAAMNRWLTVVPAVSDDPFVQRRARPAARRRRAVRPMVATTTSWSAARRA